MASAYLIGKYGEDKLSKCSIDFGNNPYEILGNNMFKYITICLLLSSCCGLHTEAKYIYKGIVVKRVDRCGETSFYYENTFGEQKGRIWVEYSGINDGFAGYLSFEENGKVTLLSRDGYFQTENIDTTLFDFEHILAHERHRNFKSKCFIQLSTKHETERNVEVASGIKTEYFKNENNWW